MGLWQCHLSGAEPAHRLNSGVVTRAISHTSAVIRVRFKEGISHVPPHPNQRLMTLLVQAAHRTTHTSVPPAHTWNQSVDIEPGPVLRKMREALNG